MLPSVSSFSYGHRFLLSSVGFSLHHSVRHRRSTATLQPHIFAAGDSFSVREVCQLDHSGGGFIFVDEFLSVPEFASNPLSQFWLGGRRYWGRGIGARPHLLLGDATPNYLFSSERFDPTTKLLSFGGEFRKIFKGGLTKNKRFFALLSSPALMQIGKLYVGYYVAMKGFYALLIGIGVGIHGVLLFITLIGKVW